LKYAKYVLTPSKHSKDLIQKIYNLPDERITYIHNGANTLELDKSRTENKFGDKFILYIGRINKMKNIQNLLKAYMLIADKTNRKLVIVGDDEASLKKEMRLAGFSSGLKKNVIFKHNLDDESKYSLIKDASVLVFISLYEGFGLPPLEAMSCGCPVIVSNNSSLPEVCGDAAYYVNPMAPSNIADGILTVLNNGSLRNKLIMNGLERARRFTWTNSGKEHLRVLEHVSNHSCLPAEDKGKILLPLFKGELDSIGLGGINT
jgi:glycosyltransferase involved in cell wall biosynthesis